MDASLNRRCSIVAAVVCGLVSFGNGGDRVHAQGFVTVKEGTPRPIHAALPPSLRDVLAHLSESDTKAARDWSSPEDFVTWCHEATHFMNSKLSTPKLRGYYTLDNEGWRVPLTKKTRLSQVAASIPAGLRGRTFKTYLVDARGDWEEIPLVLFDEWIAYQHGSMTRRELGWLKRRETEDFMAELAIYSAYMVEEVAKREPEYPVEDLRLFFSFMLERSRLIAEDFDHLPLVSRCPLVGAGK